MPFHYNARKRRKLGGKSKALSWRKRLARGRRMAVVRAKQLNPTSGWSLSSGPLRRRVRTVHQYATFITLNPGASYQTHYFSANGMHDPDITGVGHQPLGFDEMAELYDHYVVIASQLTARVRHPDIIATLRICDSTGVPASSTDLLEQRTTLDKLTGGSNEGKVYRLSKKVCPQKFLGSRKQMMDDIYKGSSSGNPAEQAYYEVGAISAYGADPGTVYIRIDMTFVAVWIEPKKVVGS